MNALLLMGLLAAGVPELIAHRGASKAAPENTLEAFRTAWKEGADAIESDWRLSSDGRIVGMHDATVDRTTEGTGKVVALSFEALRRLDAGKGERVPTLAEMLALVPKGKRTFIEVKVGPEIVPALKTELAASKVPHERIAIIAFDPNVIAAAKKALPSVKAYWLYGWQRKDGAWTATHEEV